MKRTRGFTLIEMLVVVVIILVMVTASISILSVFMRGQGIRQGGRIMSGTFMKARQLATSKKVVTYVLLDATRHTMKIYEDTDPDGPTSPLIRDGNLVFGIDTMIGDEQTLPKNIQFESSVPGSIMSRFVIIVSGTPQSYLRFFPDGSIVLPVTETTFNADAMPSGTADLILWQPGQTQKLYLDISPAAGKIRAQAYRT